MDTAVSFANAARSREPEVGVPVAGLVSAVALAAAGAWLGCSLLSSKRRLPDAGRLLLGLLAGYAGVATWKQRQAEIEAARHLIEHVHEARDARWLRKHPVAYG